MQALKNPVSWQKCARCGNVWLPRVEQPVKCPKCGHRFDSARIYQTKKLKGGVATNQENYTNPSHPADKEGS